MKKLLFVLIKILLVIIIIFTLGWYLFGQDGPLSDSTLGQYVSELVASIGAEEQENVTTEDTYADVVEQTETNEPIENIDTTTTILFTGDVELSEYVQANYDAGGIDSVVADDLKQEMTGATVTMINNEFCFSDRGTPESDKQYTFRVNPSYVSVLTDMGVDIAGLANNHCRDYGQDALTDTMSTLAEAGIEYTGAGQSLDEASQLIIKTDDMGRTYGFLAATRVIPFGSWYVENSQPGVFGCYDETNLINAITEAKTQVDYLYVMVHWGVEHTTELDNYQQSLGHDLIDAGADAVIGMHSHCLQPVEYYNNKPIFYSLGNYIFNQTINDGAAVEFIYDENGDCKVKLLPVKASNAKTYIDTSLYSYVDDMSDTIQIDSEGIITPQ